MMITIRLLEGPRPIHEPTSRGMQRNIDALQRAIDGKPLSSDFAIMRDTMSIIKGIQEQLIEMKR